jgi:DNA modification methylase
MDALARVLKDTGTVWINLGDSFAGSGKGGGDKNSWKGGTQKYGHVRVPTDGHWLRPKQLLLLPARFAIGCQERGWLLRNDVVWAKRNPMCSSKKDGFTPSYEHVFLMVKQKRYYFDLDAVREPVAESSIRRVALMDSRNESKAGSGINRQAEIAKTLADDGDGSFCPRRYKGGQGAIQSRGNHVDHLVCRPSPLGKNPGDVWSFASQPRSEDHYAAYPDELPRRAIRAGCPTQVCAECSKPWVRITETDRKPRGDNFGRRDVGGYDHGQAGSTYMQVTERRTIGWEPTCKCDADTQPGLVLDPFAGRGTTGEVALREGRRFIGLEIVPEYVEMSRKNLTRAQVPLVTP